MSMKTVQLAKDGDSGNGGCPSVHMREDGMAVVQAPEVDADTFAGLPNVLPGERAVYIKPDVILARRGRDPEARTGLAMGRRIERRDQRASSTRCSPASSTPPTGWKPSRPTT